MKNPTHMAAKAKTFVFVESWSGASACGGERFGSGGAANAGVDGCWSVTGREAAVCNNCVHGASARLCHDGLEQVRLLSAGHCGDKSTRRVAAALRWPF